MRFARVLAPPLFVVLGLSAVCRADEPKGDSGTQAKLIGTWKLVSARYGGRESALPSESTTIKHITPSQFMWASYDADGKVSRAAGGGYTLKDGVYEETPEYGISADFDLIKGKAHAFKCKIDGNKWHHDGKLDSGLTIEEVWERVEKK